MVQNNNCIFLLIFCFSIYIYIHIYVYDISNRIYRIWHKAERVVLGNLGFRGPKARYCMLARGIPGHALPGNV